jgi:hypothetical protein
MTYKKITAALLACAASVVGSAAANATTYVGSRTIGTGSVDLSITTDNTIGTLTAANILTYTIRLVNLDSTFTLTQANSAKLLTGTALTATATDLSFNFAQVGQFVFQAPSLGSSATFYCAQGVSSTCFDNLGAGEAVEANADYIFPRVARSGNQVLASASAVPEPASWAMMILGMGAVGGALRRRSKVSTSVKFA